MFACSVPAATSFPSHGSQEEQQKSQGWNNPCVPAIPLLAVERGVFKRRDLSEAPPHQVKSLSVIEG